MNPNRPDPGPWRALAAAVALLCLPAPRAAAAPGRPASLTVEAKSLGSARLRWSPPADASSVAAYEVLAGGVAVGRTSVASFEATGLAAGVPVVFRVRALDARGEASPPSNALVVTPDDAPGGVHPLAVRTRYRAVVLNYVPRIWSGGSLVSLDAKSGYRDARALVESYRRLMYRASGGQADWTVARWHDLDEFPRPAAPGSPAFDATNYEPLLGQGYDYWNNSPRGPDYAGILDDPRFGLARAINAGEVDAVWMFAPFGTGPWETAMAGPGAYYVNGGPIPYQGLTRRVVFYGFGKEGHQGVGFMCENTAHMAEVILRDRVAPSWPRDHEVPVFTTLNLDNPSRRLVPAAVNDWTRLTLSDGASWDPGLVSPGHGQAGLSHFPSTALYNYDWSTVAFAFGGLEPFRAYDGDWSASDGELRVAGGDGVKALAFDGMGMSDGLGAYHPPMAFTDADVEFGVRMPAASAGAHAGFLFRVSSAAAGPFQARGLYVGVAPAEQRVFVARVDGGLSELGRAAVATVPGGVLRLRLEVRGARVRVFVPPGLAPVLETGDGGQATGAFGFAARGGPAAFSALSVVDHVSASSADDWYAYPAGGGATRDLSPLEWNGDGNAAMDGFYAWWWEHLPKNGGVHRATDLGTGTAGWIPNSWWPLVLDPNTPAGALPAPDVQYAAEDVEAPSAPARLAAVALGGTRVGLSWDEPADDVGVTRYGLFRDGQLVRKTATPYAMDVRLEPGSVHSYAVRAYDGSGNASAASAPVTVVLPPGAAGGEVTDGGFDVHPGAGGWIEDAYRPEKARFAWESPGVGGNPGRCLLVETPEPGDSRWVQTVDGLVPGAPHWLTGRVAGDGIVPEGSGGIGANLCLFGTWDHTGETLTGTFGWRRVSLRFLAPASGTVAVAARLGYWGNLASGKAWFDDIAVVGPDTLRLGAAWPVDGGGPALELFAAPGREVWIESSTDLRSWSPVWRVTPDGPVTAMDANWSPQEGGVFYRARRP